MPPDPASRSRQRLQFPDPFGPVDLVSRQGTRSELRVLLDADRRFDELVELDGPFREIPVAARAETEGVVEVGARVGIPAGHDVRALKIRGLAAAFAPAAAADEFGMQPGGPSVVCGPVGDAHRWTAACIASTIARFIRPSMVITSSRDRSCAPASSAVSAAYWPMIRSAIRPDVGSMRGSRSLIAAD